MTLALNASMACPPIKDITINWIDLIPFLYFSLELNNITGHLPGYMKLASQKCGCPMLIFNYQRMNISSSEELEIKIRRSPRTTAPELYFPIFANHKESTQYQRPFLPLFRSPGPAVVELVIDTWNDKKSSINMILKTWPILSVCVLFGLLAGFIVWAIEHRKNPEEFPAKFPHGALAGIWWSFVTMTTVGYGDKTTRTFWGRMFAVFWMVLGTIVMSMFTGQITANITSSKMGTVDLMDTKVAAPKGMKTFVEQEMNLGAHTIVEMTYNKMQEKSSDLKTIDYFMIHDYNMARNWLATATDAKIVKIIDRQFDIGMTVTGNYEPVETMLACIQREVIDVFQIFLAQEKLEKTSASSSSTNKQETGLTSQDILMIVSGGALVLCVLFGFLLKCVCTRKPLTPSDVEQASPRPTFATDLELPTIR